ncbi:hypothetical protein H1C71_006222 [Ictidomys tridecemlineatus]|nr:hypothetical protein H1C71_006222 [Ictidomys tridecemlineatus]
MKLCPTTVWGRVVQSGSCPQMERSLHGPPLACTLLTMSVGFLMQVSPSISGWDYQEGKTLSYGRVPWLRQAQTSMEGSGRGLMQCRPPQRRHLGSLSWPKSALLEHLLCPGLACRPDVYSAPRGLPQLTPGGWGQGQAVASIRWGQTQRNLYSEVSHPRVLGPRGLQFPPQYNGDCGGAFQGRLC